MTKSKERNVKMIIIATWDIIIYCVQILRNRLSLCKRKKSYTWSIEDLKVSVKFASSVIGKTSRIEKNILVPLNAVCSA